MKCFSFSVLLILWISSLGFCAPQSEDEAEKLFYQGLRQRGLFSIVESSLQEDLTQQGLSPERRAYLQLELSKTYAAHAQQRLGQEQEELWGLAKNAAESQLLESQETKWTTSLLLQSTLVPVQKTRFALFQYQLTPGNDELRKQIVSELHEHLKKLRQLEVSLNQKSRSILVQYRENTQNISPFEFRSVQKDVIYQIAQTLTEIAEVEYTSPPERSPPARAALDRLQILTAGADDESVTWKARLLAIRCYWLQHDFETARLLIQRYENDWPSEFRNSVVGEKARIELENQQPDLAFERLESWRQRQGYLAGELSLLNLRAIAALWEIAWRQDRDQLAADLLAQLKAEAAKTQQDVGGIWAWRAEYFVQKTLQATQYGPDVAAKIQSAQTAYQANQFDDAVFHYRQAAELAASKNRPEIASEMLFTAGSVLIQSANYAEAQDVFRRGVDQFPETDRTADNHLMWVWCLGKTYEQRPTKSHRLEYTSALDEHLELFRNNTTTGSAHLMYGQFQETRLQDTIAVEHYLSVSPKHPKHIIADLALLRCYERILNRLREQHRSTEAWQTEAISRLSQRTTVYGEDPTQYSTQICRVLLGLIRLHLGQTRHDHDHVIDMLNHVIQACDLHNSESPDAQLWKSIALSAYRLKIVFLAQSGKTREANALLSQVANAGLQSLLELLDGLSKASAEASPQTKKGIAELQLQTCQSLNAKREMLSTDQKMLLDKTMARSLILAERTMEAHEKYEMLIQNFPDDLQLRHEYAVSLSACETVACHQKALTHWEYLESREPKGSQDWMKFRAEVIRSLIEVGKTSEAERLLKITNLLYPEMGNQGLEDQYRKLKQKIDREN